MSKATFPEKLKAQIALSLPMIDRNIKSKASTSRQQLLKTSGLNDNQLQFALKLAFGKAPKPVYKSPTGGKMYDSESLLRVLAKWCGMWAYVIED
ncbi:MAG TPA: hypothetical protein PL036_05450 [Bifidobacterium adolescentis]|nr:hypothetical protein [Bifidobacterium adolescentis]